MLQMDAKEPFRMTLRGGAKKQSKRKRAAKDQSTSQGDAKVQPVYFNIICGQTERSVQESLD